MPNKRSIGQNLKFSAKLAIYTFNIINRPNLLDLSQALNDLDCATHGIGDAYDR